MNPTIIYLTIVFAHGAFMASQGHKFDLVWSVSIVFIMGAYFCGLANK